ncbi:MAG: hypothetical protein WAW88_13050 [Nocardioides sp.]
MRRTLDRLISWMGLLLALVLIVAGGLLWWANSFISDQVSEQLAMQNITMPEKDQLETKAQKDALSQYAGQEMTTGDQAKAYADHYILEHMNAASGGRTYSEVSGEFMQMSSDPAADQEKVAELGQLRQTLFMGSTLRGLLLNAYAFGTIGKIAGLASVAAFIAAILMLLLGLLGLRHAARVES